MTVKLLSSPVELIADQHPRIRISPMYHSQGFSDDPHVYIQKEAQDRLITAVGKLPNNYGVVIWDVYRSRKVQGVMFDWMKGQVREKKPSLSPDQVHEEAKKYMSAPTEVGDAHIPPHLSGGAVDLTLFDVNTGNEVNMGTPFDDCSDVAHAYYYEQLVSLKPEQVEIREARRTLRSAMIYAGFVSYRYEWWHFDYGNVFWSNVTGNKQIFGPLFGDLDYPTK